MSYVYSDTYDDEEEFPDDELGWSLFFLLLEYPDAEEGTYPERENVE